MNTTSVYQKCHEQLLLQRTLTIARLAGADQIANTWEIDPQEREAARISRQELRAKLERIERAMQRFADGRYGTCLGCGQPINAERLEYYPLADTCVNCQRAVERNAFRRSHHATATNR